MDESTKKQKILKDPGFIAIKRFDFDIEQLLTRYPEQVPDSVIAQALLMDEEEVAGLYEMVVRKLRRLMGA